MSIFNNWLELKEKLHNLKSPAPLVSEGEIWWASLGQNIGSEINGKSSLFSRPVIIYRVFAHGFYLVIPTTTQFKEGTWYVRVAQKNRLISVCLHQIRAIDYRRLSNRIGRLDDKDLVRVKDGFDSLYK